MLYVFSLLFSNIFISKSVHVHQVKIQSLFSDNCVIISSNGTNDPLCLNNSSQTPCKTASYPTNQGFTDLCFSGTFQNVFENFGTFNKTGVSNETRTLIMSCKECMLKNTDVTLSGYIDRIYFINFTMVGGTIKLSNVSVTFQNTSLNEVLIQDYKETTEDVNNQIHFEHSNMSCSDSHECGLKLTESTAAKITFIKSKLTNFRLVLTVSQLVLTFQSETVILEPRIDVTVTSPEFLKIPAIIRFEKTTIGVTGKTNDISLRNKRSVNSERSTPQIALHLTNPFISIQECQFNQSHLEIHSKKQGFEPFLFSLLITKSHFMNSHHAGNGGALMINSEVQNSLVTITSCTFLHNTASQGQGALEGHGGALYAKATSLELHIEDSVFVNNRASDSGFVLYSTLGVMLLLLNNTFHYDVTPNEPIIQPLVFATGLVTKFMGQIEIDNARPESYAGSINVLYIAQGQDLNVQISCPQWYNHMFEYTTTSTSDQSLPDIKYQCIPCSDNYYTTVSNNNILLHDMKDGNNVPIMTKDEVSDMCTKCPYGAVCTGNNVRPRPNYWGYRQEEGLSFQQCPAGYCCSGSDSSTCNVYDYCDGNRTGILCGACRDGFSVSILTGECTPDSQCGGDQWFWLFAILATVAYALWYTFKDDIFGIFFASIAYIKTICCKSKSKNNVEPFEGVPPNREPSVVSIKSKENIVAFDKANDNISDNCSTSSNEQNADDDADKAYFGIITYYVQMAAVITIQIEFSDIDKSESLLDKIAGKIVTNIEIF